MSEGTKKLTLKCVYIYKKLSQNIINNAKSLVLLNFDFWMHEVMCDSFVLLNFVLIYIVIYRERNHNTIDSKKNSIYYLPFTPWIHNITITKQLTLIQNIKIDS